MIKNERTDNAVSPVVGVMLMLVVTIIIAAVVSAFAGGLGQSSQKAPQLSIGAEAHNGQDIIVDFKGGDTLNGGAITVKTFIPMGDFKDMSYKVNLSDTNTTANVVYLPTNTPLHECVYDPTYDYTTCTWHTISPGDKIQIKWADAFAASSYGGYLAPSAGEPVDIEIYDSASGKQIASTRATVIP
jgi:flagellin-like protein